MSQFFAVRLVACYCSDGSSANEGASEVGSPARKVSSSNAAAHGTRTAKSTDHRGVLCSASSRILSLMTESYL